MVQKTIDQQAAGEDPSQSPEMLDMQRKLRLFVLWSVLFAFLAIAVILGAIIYKSMSRKESAAPIKDPAAPISHRLKPGEKVREMIIENGVVYLLVDASEGSVILQIDKKTGEIARRLEFIPQGK